MSSLLQWRLRLVALRLVLVLLVAGGLLLLAARHMMTPDAALWTATVLPLLPCLWLAPTRGADERRQRLLLGLELAMDMALFLALIWHLGGAGNPLTFCLLIPVLIAGLALPIPAGVASVLFAILGYGLLLYWHRVPDSHSGLHALAHDLNLLHGQGMWFVFSVLAVVLCTLGQALQHGQRQRERTRALALSLALQRERMYELAGNLADRAHELNTPLSTLLLVLDELETADGEGVRHHLPTLRALADRIAGVLRPAEPGDDDPGTVPLARLVDEVARRLRLLAPALKVEHDDAGTVQVPAEDWRRILLNLGYNAADAGASCMRVRIRPGDPLVLHVEDDGPLHPARPRRGLGIGLALVESTLAALGGELSIERDARCTRIVLRCPAAMENPSCAPC